MNLVVKTSSSKTAPKLTYDVLIENEQDGRFNATVLGLPDCKISGATKEEALKELIQRLQARLEKAEIVTLEIDPPQTEHPWIKFAGMHKDNPLFAEVLEYIEAERSQIDLENETK
ncbi:hypothetical protein FNW02_22025 [Komarekiella sp. 'clone 1']|uniref:HicB-like antitoxin of toxin-antitoxin system domain-containing protein n=1 Tax=Komarekiella delphini-convector SJRDD-AB1 TaxID=2593771 RepID=A0AA40T035_9NOST|nr:hypothetical protein [Komarekiella delphini-convector]MBD6618428.1 hypothetical protein [Komarekiella delphini-convector SJRDD-AB1]